MGITTQHTKDETPSFTIASVINEIKNMKQLAKMKVTEEDAIAVRKH